MIGIASSVAAADQFDWLKILEYAAKLNLSLVQLYLDNNNIINHARSISGHDFFYTGKSYFHLPKFPEKRFLDTLESFHFPGKPVFIQHESAQTSSEKKWLNDNHIRYGLENDTVDNDLVSFRKLLQSSQKQTHDLLMVMDVSRFYIQFINNHSESDIYQEIINLFIFAKARNIPVIFHIVDHHGFSGNREDWCPLFEGSIPWKSILNDFSEINPPFDSFIFEYEDFEITKQSLRKLKAQL